MLINSATPLTSPCPFLSAAPRTSGRESPCGGPDSGMAELLCFGVMNPPGKMKPGSLRLRDDAGSDRYRALPGGLRLVCRGPSYERLNGKEKYRSSEICSVSSQAREMPRDLGHCPVREHQRKQSDRAVIRPETLKKFMTTEASGLLPASGTPNAAVGHSAHPCQLLVRSMP